MQHATRCQRLKRRIVLPWICGITKPHDHFVHFVICSHSLGVSYIPALFRLKFSPNAVCYYMLNTTSYSPEMHRCNFSCPLRPLRWFCDLCRFLTLRLSQFSRCFLHLCCLAWKPRPSNAACYKMSKTASYSCEMWHHKPLRLVRPVCDLCNF